MNMDNGTCEFNGCTKRLEKTPFVVYVPKKKAFKKYCMTCKRKHFKGEPSGPTFIYGTLAVGLQISGREEIAKT